MATEQTTSGLERARLAAGLSLPEVATHLTRTVQTVRRWERGRHMPPQAALLSLARIYGCPVTELVD